MAIEYRKLDVQQVMVKEATDGTKFFYFHVGETKVWVSSRLVQEEKDRYYIKDDVHGNSRLEITSKGGLVLKPGNRVVAAVIVECGYRGDSSYQIVEERGVNRIIPVEIYHSPRGSLGISAGFIFEAETYFYLKLKWERTGRTYGAPKEGTAVVEMKGVVEVDEDIDELKDLLED